MKKVSDKQARLNTEYSKIRRDFLANKEICHAKLHCCTLKTTDVHHMKGRGKYLLDTSTWLPVCRKCHMWIETHPEEAKELGFSISRNE